MELPIVSIIIPVYNAEQTLPVCLDSLLRQTYPYMELLFVDDCSTDKSLTIIQETVNSKGSPKTEVIILRHNENRGVAAARNTGLEYATGDYIYYVDSDDRIDTDTLESFVREAEKTGADIIGCNWYLAFNNNERQMNQPVFRSAEEALQKMMAGVMRWNLWLFFVRRSLYEENGIRFTEGMNIGEDMMMMIKLFANTNKVTYVNKAFYHYSQTNVNSLTRIYSKRHIREVTGNVLEVERYLRSTWYSEQLKENIHFLKLNIKLPLLITDDVSRYKLWLDWFPESNRFVIKNKLLPFRTRLLQWAAARKCFFAVRLYYWLIVRFVYGVIYK